MEEIMGRKRDVGVRRERRVGFAVGGRNEMRSPT